MGLATNVEASRRAARAALLERLASHPFAVGVRARVDAVVQARADGEDLRQPLQALVQYCARVSTAASSTLPIDMSAVEHSRLSGFQRASTQLGIVLGRLAGSEPVTDAQLHGALARVEESLQELLLCWETFGDELLRHHGTIDLV